MSEALPPPPGEAKPREVRHHALFSNRDFDFYFNGLEDEQLLVQKCGDCGFLRNFPAAMCEKCQSLDFTTIPLSGKGVIYSYTVHYHPPLPAFDTPHPVVLAEMEEGVRILGSLTGVDPETVEIGAPVKAEFFRVGEMASFRFRLA